MYQSLSVMVYIDNRGIDDDEDADDGIHLNNDGDDYINDKSPLSISVT